MASANVLWVNATGLSFTGTDTVVMAFTASNYTTNFEAYRAFAGAYQTNGWTVSNTGTCWIQLDAGQAVSASGYILACPTSYTTRTPKNWTLQGSNTGAFAGEQTTVDTQTNITTWVAGLEYRYSLSSTQSFRYWRLVSTACNDASYTGLGSFKLIVPAASGSAARQIVGGGLVL